MILRCESLAAVARCAGRLDRIQFCLDRAPGYDGLELYCSEVPSQSLVATLKIEASEICEYQGRPRAMCWNQV